MYERTYHKSVLKQEGGAKKHSPFPWRQAAWIIGTLAVIVGFVFLVRVPGLQIRTVTVEGVHVADPEAVSQFVLNRLSGYRLRVLPRSSMLLASTDALEQGIGKEFTRFADVSVGRTNLHELSVTVREYEGVYVWCAQGADLDDCFFMDQNGIVFAPAPYFSGSAYPKVYVGEQDSLPFQPISDAELHMMHVILERFPTVSITPTAFHFVSAEELHVSFTHNGREVKIFFDQGKNIDKSLDTLFSGMRAQSFNMSYHSSRVLEYIDLRFSNKMVYKFQ